MTKTKFLNSQAEKKSEMIAACPMMVDAYSPPGDETMTDIADVVCRIMDDDEPKPMARLRPTKRIPNAADQFHSDHQAPYEAYGARSHDRLENVHQHNSGYPKMQTVLNRKRSTGKATMNFAQRNGIAQRTAYRCNNCIKNKKRPCPVKRKIPPSRNSERRKETWMRVGPRRASIVKPKLRQRTGERQRITTKSRRTLGCQKMTMMEKGTVTCCDFQKTPRGESKDKSSESQYSEDSKVRSNETDASVSSYNSYASLEHEPMVSN